MAELTVLGKYEIRRELGRGAMGVVYEGYDPMIKRRVALKTIRADQLGGENAETAIARFRREAQAAGRLNHPGIVSIYDFGEDAGVWYIAMEFVEGRELKDYFQANERFATADIVRIMAQILDALGYSHRMGVVHRDVKPSNVILLPDGGVKVADFGIAHVDSSSMTQVGTVLGTPSYMSPEQIMGLPVDGRSDLFSAGVILYQFLTGERPFTGSSTATMHKVLEEDPLPPSRFNVQIPGAMDAVVRKALAKRPDDRYRDAEEFAAALRAAVGRPESPAAEPTLIVTPAAATSPPHGVGSVATLVASAPAATGATAPPAGPPAPASKRSQAPAIAVVVAIVGIAAAAGLWTFMQKPSRETPGVATAPAGPSTATPSAAGAPPPPAAAAPPPAPAGVAAAATATSAPRPPEPGTITIAAVGLVDPSDPRYAVDKALLQSDLRADSKSQLVEKALGLMLEPASLAKNYDLLRDRLMARSASYITAVVGEGAPQTGRDGLASMTTQAVVDVKALQKSLNQLSRDERIELIRASGDPRIAVRIAVRDADRPDAPAQPSVLAENLVKERIKSFGFRTWAEDGAPSGAHAGPDFVVAGEAQVKKLSMRLEASGIVVTKFTLAAWTVKCTDRATGEEIYFNTALPKGAGSWASEGDALKAIGARMADEFSRDFFLAHVNVGSRKVALVVEGLPDAATGDALARELIGLPAVITATPRPPSAPRVFDLQVAGTGAAGDAIAAGVLKPLNAKLGRACFGLGRVEGEQVVVAFDGACGDATVLSRLETNPPAGLYSAPPARQRAVIRNPETLRRLTI